MKTRQILMTIAAVLLLIAPRPAQAGWVEWIEEAREGVTYITLYDDGVENYVEYRFIYTGGNYSLEILEDEYFCGSVNDEVVVPNRPAPTTHSACQIYVYEVILGSLELDDNKYTWLSHKLQGLTGAYEQAHGPGQYIFHEGYGLPYLSRDAFQVRADLQRQEEELLALAAQAEIDCAVEDPHLDCDEDTVKNRHDLCPEVRGTVLANGCPDQDNDGHADADDQCPDQPGSLANGCPEVIYEVGGRTRNSVSTSVGTLVLSNSAELSTFRVWLDRKEGQEFEAYTFPGSRDHLMLHGEDFPWNYDLNRGKYKLRIDTIVGTASDGMIVEAEWIFEVHPGGQTTLDLSLVRQQLVVSGPGHAPSRRAVPVPVVVATGMLSITTNESVVVEISEVSGTEPKIVIPRSKGSMINWGDEPIHDDFELAPGSYELLVMTSIDTGSDYREMEKTRSFTLHEGQTVALEVQCSDSGIWIQEAGTQAVVQNNSDQGQQSTWVAIQGEERLPQGMPHEPMELYVPDWFKPAHFRGFLSYAGMIGNFGDGKHLGDPLDYMGNIGAGLRLGVEGGFGHIWFRGYYLYGHEFLTGPYYHNCHGGGVQAALGLGEGKQRFRVWLGWQGMLQGVTTRAGYGDELFWHYRHNGLLLSLDFALVNTSAFRLRPELGGVFGSGTLKGGDREMAAFLFALNFEFGP